MKFCVKNIKYEEKNNYLNQKKIKIIIILLSFNKNNNY